MGLLPVGAVRDVGDVAPQEVGPTLQSCVSHPLFLTLRPVLVQEGIYPIIEDIRHLSLPAIQALTEILIWKKSTVTMVIVVILLIISALFSWAAYLHRTAGQSGNMSRAEEVTTLAPWNWASTGLAVRKCIGSANMYIFACTCPCSGPTFAQKRNNKLHCMVSIPARISQYVPWGSTWPSHKQFCAFDKVELTSSWRGWPFHNSCNAWILGQSLHNTKNQWGGPTPAMSYVVKPF